MCEIKQWDSGISICSFVAVSCLQCNYGEMEIVAFQAIWFSAYSTRPFTLIFIPATVCLAFHFRSLQKNRLETVLPSRLICGFAEKWLAFELLWFLFDKPKRALCSVHETLKGSCSYAVSQQLWARINEHIRIQEGVMRPWRIFWIHEGFQHCSPSNLPHMHPCAHLLENKH